MFDLKNIKSPLSVQLEITNLCDCRCLFCYNDTLSFKGKNLPFSEAKKIIDELAENDVFEIVITGGECLMNDEIFDIISYIKSKNMVCAIITNGTKLKQNVYKLKETGLDQVQVSLLGSNSDMHDKLTKTYGNFTRIIEGIQLCLEYGLHVTVNTTVIRQNYSDIENILNMLLDIGCTTYTVSRYVHNGIFTDTEFDLNGEELANILKMFLLYRDKIHSKVLTNIPLCAIEKHVNIEEVSYLLTKCDGGKTWVSIDIDKNIYPCPCLRLNVGNLKSKSLVEIWRQDKLLHSFKEDNVLQMNCKDCDYLQLCGGGCKSFHDKNINNNSYIFKDPLSILGEKYV